MPETDKSLVGLETTAEERAIADNPLYDWPMGWRYKLLRDFDRLQASLASMTERAEKAERERDEASAGRNHHRRKSEVAKGVRNKALDSVLSLVTERDALRARVDALERALKPYIAKCGCHDGYILEASSAATIAVCSRCAPARAALSKETSDG